MSHEWRNSQQFLSISAKSDDVRIQHQMWNSHISSVWSSFTSSVLSKLKQLVLGHICQSIIKEFYQFTKKKYGVQWQDFLARGGYSSI